MFGNPCQKPVLLVYISLLVSPVVHSSYRFLVIAIISFLDTFFQSRARSNKYVFCFVSCLLYCVSCILYCVFCILHFAFCIYSDHIQSWHFSSQNRALLRQPYPQPTPYLALSHLTGRFIRGRIKLISACGRVLSLEKFYPFSISSSSSR